MTILKTLKQRFIDPKYNPYFSKNIHCTSPQLASEVTKLLSKAYMLDPMECTGMGGHYKTGSPDNFERQKITPHSGLQVDPWRVPMEPLRPPLKVAKLEPPLKTFHNLCTLDICWWQNKMFLDLKLYTVTGEALSKGVECLL